MRARRARARQARTLTVLRSSASQRDLRVVEVVDTSAQHEHGTLRIGELRDARSRSRRRAGGDRARRPRGRRSCAGVVDERGVLGPAQLVERDPRRDREDPGRQRRRTGGVERRQRAQHADERLLHEVGHAAARAAGEHAPDRAAWIALRDSACIDELRQARVFRRAARPEREPRRVAAAMRERSGGHRRGVTREGERKFRKKSST